MKSNNSVQQQISKMLPSIMSEVDVLLSQVNVLLSNVDVSLSKCPEVSKSSNLLLPRIGNILTQMQGIVSHHLMDASQTANLSWDDDSHLVWYPEVEDEFEGFENQFFTYEIGEEVRGEEVRGEEVDDEEVRDEEVGDEEEDFSIADRVKVRRCKLQGVKAEASTSTSTPNKKPSPKKKKEKENKDSFLTVTIRALNKLSPKSVYSKQVGEVMRKERITRKIANIVPDTLRSLWESAEMLRVDSEEVKVSVKEPYPSLDWSKVNSRFINNIPKPTNFPIHGCSFDPAIYEWRDTVTTTHQCGEVFTNKRKTNPRFEFYAPFGTEWGYRTSAGIISVSNITHHGYIWNDGDWILHAEQPRSEVKKENNKFNFRRKFKEKKEATQNLSFMLS